MELIAAKGERGRRGFKPPVSGLWTEAHGGDCCGMTHIHGFPYTERMDELSLEDKVSLINAVMRNRLIIEFSEDPDDEDERRWAIKEIEDYHKCFEVVLIREQLAHWEEALITAGFNRVFSFENSNTGNQCHVFLTETNFKKGVEAL